MKIHLSNPTTTKCVFWNESFHPNNRIFRPKAFFGMKKSITKSSQYHCFERIFGTKVYFFGMIYQGTIRMTFKWCFVFFFCWDDFSSSQILSQTIEFYHSNVGVQICCSNKYTLEEDAFNSNVFHCLNANHLMFEHIQFTVQTSLLHGESLISDESSNA